MRLSVPGTFLLAAAIAIAATRAPACLQYSEAKRIEMSWNADDVRAMTGRFLHLPPEFERRRLDLARARFAAEGTLALEQYDAAAVAADRLHLFDEAIEWMTRKRDAIDRLGPDPATRRLHEYRYHANLGTHHAHRWIASGASDTDRADLHRAVEHIETAIRIEPGAHYGREGYQLRALVWLRDARRTDGEMRTLPDFLNLKSDPSVPVADQTAALEGDLDKAEDGLLGLMTLGAAWESVDVLNALARVYEAQGKRGETIMARLRMDELIDEGRGSLFPGAPKGNALKRITGIAGDSRLHVDRNFRRRYDDFRYQASLYRERTGDFVRAQLARGLHPDTHDDFWTGYSEPNVDGLREPFLHRTARRHRGALLLAGGVGLFLGASGIAQRFRSGRGKRRTR